MLRMQDSDHHREMHTWEPKNNAGVTSIHPGPQVGLSNTTKLKIVDQGNARSQHGLFKNYYYILQILQV